MVGMMKGSYTRDSCSHYFVLRGYFFWWLRGLDSVGLAGGLVLSLWVVNT